MFLLLVEVNLRTLGRLRIDFLILEGKLKFAVRVSIGGKEPMKSAENTRTFSLWVRPGAYVLCG